MTTHGISRLPWPASTAEHRWYGLGRYYAMFPAPFVTNALTEFTCPDDMVMDPFSGRGNAPFLAAAMGRPSISIDILPIAWLFTVAKLKPSQNADDVLSRLQDIRRAVRPHDCRARSEFEKMAWSSIIRGFLRAARRELNWKESSVDQTLMAFIALHMQDSTPSGLSNRLSPTVAHSPSYAVQWWAKQGLLDPPQTDPVAFLTKRIQRRYAFGVPNLAYSTTKLGDARTELEVMSSQSVRLLITSPPYHGVTDYWNDQWIRLWLLGADMHKDWKRTQKHSHLGSYRELIEGVFAQAKRHVREDGVVIVRCGDKPTTADTCREAIKSMWPRWEIFERRSEVTRRGKASGYGHESKTIYEVDIISAPEELSDRARSWAVNPAL